MGYTNKFISHCLIPLDPCTQSLIINETLIFITTRNNMLLKDLRDKTMANEWMYIPLIIHKINPSVD